MARITGKNAKVYLNNTLITGSHNWVINDNCDLQEDTAFDNDGHKHNVAGNDGWDGTVDLNFDTSQDIHSAVGANVLPGEELSTCKFYVNSTKYYDGTIMVSGITTTSPQAGLVVKSIIFVGQGQLGRTHL